VRAEIRRRLQASLVLVGEIGGNDYNYAFFQAKPVAEVEKLIPGVVKTIVGAAKEVLDMGATRVIVPGNFPIGCVPGYLAMNAASSEPADYDSAGCLRELNDFAAKHNSRLRRAVADLQASYPGAAVAYADYFDSFLTLLHNASSFGTPSSLDLSRMRDSNHPSPCRLTTTRLSLCLCIRFRRREHAQGLLRRRRRRVQLRLAADVRLPGDGGVR
jgi:hypothetical protein